MNDSSPNDFAIETQIDSICDAFEKSLRDGESPELINFVDQLADTKTQEHPRRLATELILLDLDYRMNRGDSPSMEEYVLPAELQQAAADAFQKIGGRNEAAEGTPSLEMDPNKRYTSTAEITNDLRAFAKGDPLMVRPPSIVEVARMWLGANFGNVLWVPIIALLVGIRVGVSIWLMAYGDRSSNWDTVYANFSPEHRPTIPFRLIHWVDGLALPILFLVMTSLGWATAKLVQTKNITADWSVGLAVGPLAGLIAFICGAGAPLVDSQTRPNDSKLLFGLAGSPGSSAPLENLLKRYPDLERLSRYNQAALLSDKISIDQAGCWKNS